MEIKCSSCGQNYEVDPEHAGMELECSQCNSPITVPVDLGESESIPLAQDSPGNVPEDTFESESPIALARKPDPTPEPDPVVQEPVETLAKDNGTCPKCKAALKPNAKICIECGHNLQLGMNVKTVAKAKKAGSFGLAVGIAAGTALVSALIWAGIAIAINMEIGWVAWGVGLLIGGSVILMTEERSARLGVVAVVLAICAILLGKLIYVNYGLDDAIKKEFKKDQAAMADMLFLDMVGKKQFNEKYLNWIEENGVGSDEALAKIPEEEQNLIKQEEVKFASRLSNLSKTEKERLASVASERIVASITYMDKLSATCSFWDILWIILAISSAWKMATGDS